MIHELMQRLLFVPLDRFNKNKAGGEKEEEEITYVVQVSKHGIKTWNRIHVNVVPRFMNKPKTAETISEFRIHVQEVSNDAIQIDDHVVIDGRLNELSTHWRLTMQQVSSSSW